MTKQPDRELLERVAVKIAEAEGFDMRGKGSFYLTRKAEEIPANPRIVRWVKVARAIIPVIEQHLNDAARGAPAHSPPG